MSKERVALVTGAASAIGTEVVRELAKTCRVVIGLNGNGAGSPDLNAWCVENGTQYLPRHVDVTSEESVALAYRATVEPLGRLDIVVHCAEMTPSAGRSYPTEEMSLADWNSVLDANMTATFLICREAVPHLERNGWGRIITIGSLAARVASVSSGSHYSASKAGVAAFTKVLALELAPLGITVNCVAPGLTQTRMTSGSWDLEAFGKSVPLGRVGQALDIAEAVAFIASDAAEYVTGTTLDVNGGSFMA